MTTAPLTARAAGRRVGALHGKGQLCPCCYSLAPRTQAAQKLRRTQRRIERQAWKAEVAA